MSSFFDSASLVQIPSGYSDGTLYSVKPIDGTGDLTFSRGSDIEATRVASNGYIEKAKVNLLTYSNDTSNAAWTRVGAAPTSGQSGYDGSSDAWLLSATGAGAHYALQSKADTGVFTFSLYAKQGTSKGIRIAINGGGDHWANFNLDLGTQIGTAASVVDTEIVSVGSGWYRISVTANKTGSGWAVIYVLDNSFNTSFTASGETIYIQDAQLNYGLVAQEYVETTTTSVVSGITNDMPRLNYDPANPTCPSLLLEKSSTNEIPNSEYLSAWGASNVSVTQNTAISPEGVQNASTIEVTTQTASQGLAQGFVADGTSYYTISGYYKKTATFQRAQLKIRDFLGSGTTYGFVDLDLSTGSVLASIGTYSVTSFNSDWWYIQVTTGSVPSAGIRRAVIRLDNQTVGTQVTAYGIMVEKGTYATSYIPTYGSSATRTADACSKTGISSLIGQTEGTIFVEFDHDITATAPLDTRIHLSSGTTANWIFFGFPDGAAKLLRFYINDSSGALSFYSSAPVVQGKNKVAFGYKSGDFVAYLNGTQVASNSTVRSIPVCSQIDLQGGAPNSGAQERANIEQALLFKTRLSNADLATLTSL